MNIIYCSSSTSPGLKSQQTLNVPDEDVRSSTLVISGTTGNMLTVSKRVRQATSNDFFAFMSKSPLTVL